jgi:hypothetical protein
MKILTFVTVASFGQWHLQHGTYFPDKTQSTEFLHWYLIVSIYKQLQYIWIFCQFLAIVEIDFQCHQDWIDSTSIPMRIDTILSLKVRNKLGFLPIALAFDEIDF